MKPETNENLNGARNAAGQEIVRVLWNLKIHHRTNNLQYFTINPI